MVFFVVRIIFGSYITRELWLVFVFRDENDPNVTNINAIPKFIWISMLVINVLFHCLNLHWFTFIINHIIGKG